MFSDPQFPNGWHSATANEIGDICEGQYGSFQISYPDGTTNTWAVQKLYSLYAMSLRRLRPRPSGSPAPTSSNGCLAKRGLPSSANNALVGQPYDLANWCVLFSIPVQPG